MTDETMQLTETEARVLFSALSRTWAPAVGYVEFRSALDKLGKLGKGYCCRDCVELGRYSSRYGGFCCATHKASEDERFASDWKSNTNPGER